MTNIKPKIEQIDAFVFPKELPKPGPLHTIQVDEEQCIYFSDELNHRIVSLDGHGAMRWQLSGNGSSPAQFHYPRGIAIGWILIEGRPIRCVGVADAWNRRIQFFNLGKGTFLNEWRTALNMPFQEPVDIRFITLPYAEDSGSFSGYWLVLDKENHCLVTMDMSGKALRQWGTFLSPCLADQWAASGVFPDQKMMGTMTQTDGIRYDLLFYPERILGSTTEALYLWEPYRCRLKLIVNENFIPLSIGTFTDRQWIAADGTGLMEWSRTERRINSYSMKGEALCSDSIEGTPVCSNLPSNEFWLQRENGIYRERIVLPDSPGEARSGLVQCILLHSADEVLKGSVGDSAQSNMESILNITDQIIALADPVFAALAEKKPVSPEPVGHQEELPLLVGRLKQAQSALSEDLKGFNFALLQVRLAQYSLQGNEEVRLPPHARQLWNLFSEALSKKFAQLVRYCDDLFILKMELQDASEPPPPQFSDNLEFANGICGYIEEVVNLILTWHSRDCEHPSLPGSLFHEIKLDPEQDGIPAAEEPVLCERNINVCGSSLILRELKPLDCMKNSDALGAPTFIEIDDCGNLFVSIRLVNKILVLSSDGRIQSALGCDENGSVQFDAPAGIALDGDGCLWVADTNNQRILVFEKPYTNQNLIRVFGLPEYSFKLPFGLLVYKKKNILITDPGANSILGINSDGAVKTLISKRGSESDCVKIPNSFCLDAVNPGEYFWLVDRRNHRLLKMDFSGRSVKELGSCGLYPGCFYYPAAVAMFSDGVLVVSEGPINPKLIFLTTEGEEIGRLHLDYYPYGLSARDGLLYVCQHKYNYVRRYVRKSF